MSWKNRIAGHGTMPVAELAEQKNPDNWRLHPGSQRDGLLQVLGEVGLVQTVIVNQTTGRMVDGHLRVELAKEQGEASLPVTFVELSEDEERLILATLDPLAGLAQVDEKLLRELVGKATIPDGSLTALVDSMLAPFNAPDDPQREWDAAGMPEFENEDSTFRDLKVHFKDQAGVDRFVEVTGAKLTDKTKFIWFE